MGDVSITALSVSAVQLSRFWSLRYNIVLGEGWQGGRREGNDWDKQGDKIRVVFFLVVMYCFVMRGCLPSSLCVFGSLCCEELVRYHFDSDFECLNLPHAMCSKKVVEANLPLGFRCIKKKSFLHSALWSHVGEPWKVRGQYWWFGINDMTLALECNLNGPNVP